VTVTASVDASVPACATLITEHTARVVAITHFVDTRDIGIAFGF
jgi:hypothetical protein